MVTDPISDLIIRLKNASAVRKTEVSIPFSKLKFSVAQKLREEGFVKSVGKRGKKIKKNIEIELIYGSDGRPRIDGVERISKPGRRLYGKSSDMHPVRHGRGLLIVSTPGGILSGSEARQKKMGGELMFKIW